jgi:hypothetical protein
MTQRRREKRIKVRGKRLDQLDDTKLALAIWLLSREVVIDRTERAQPVPKSGSDDIDEAVSEATRADAKEAA